MKLKLLLPTATYKPQSLENTGLFGVAVPKNTATRTATRCYPKNLKGGR